MQLIRGWYTHQCDDRYNLIGKNSCPAGTWDHFLLYFGTRLQPLFLLYFQTEGVWLLGNGALTHLWMKHPLASKGTRKKKNSAKLVFFSLLLRLTPLPWDCPDRTCALPIIVAPCTHGLLHVDFLWNLGVVRGVAFCHGIIPPTSQVSCDYEGNDHMIIWAWWTGHQFSCAHVRINRKN